MGKFAVLAVTIAVTGTITMPTVQAANPFKSNGDKFHSRRMRTKRAVDLALRQFESGGTTRAICANFVQAARVENTAQLEGDWASALDIAADMATARVLNWRRLLPVCTTRLGLAARVSQNTERDAFFNQKTLYRADADVQPELGNNPKGTRQTTTVESSNAAVFLD